MADHGHDITMSARLGPQNAKAVLGIMVRDALDETSKGLLRLLLGQVFHGRRDIITNCTQAILLKPATRRQRWWRDLASRLKLFQPNIEVVSKNPQRAICRKTIGAKPIRADRRCERITLRDGDAGEEITSYRIGRQRGGSAQKCCGLSQFSRKPIGSDPEK